MRCRRAVLILATVLAAAVLVAACGESEYHYVSSSEAKTYFKVPSDWRVFDEDEILTGEGGLSPQKLDFERQRRWVVGFDAAPEPTVTNIQSPHDGPYPAGQALVRVLTAEERDGISLKTLRGILTQGNDPLDLAEENEEAVEVLVKEDVTRPGGLRGTHLVFNLASDTGGFVTTNYLGLVDHETQLLYLLVISCEADCYVDHEGQINEIIDSWTVKER